MHIITSPDICQDKYCLWKCVPAKEVTLQAMLLTGDRGTYFSVFLNKAKLKELIIDSVRIR